MPFNPNRTPPKNNHRDRSLSAGRTGNPFKRKAEGSAEKEKERKSRSTSKKANTTGDATQVNADFNTPNTPQSKINHQVNVDLNKPKDTKTKIGKKPASDTHCSHCGGKFDDDNCVFCECCKRWFHAACVDLSQDEIKAFALLGPKAHWYCENCDAGAKELYQQHVEFKTCLDKLEKTVIDVKTNQSNIQSDIAKIQIDVRKERDDIDSNYEDITALKAQEIATSNKVKANSESVVQMRASITPRRKAKIKLR